MATIIQTADNIFLASNGYGTELHLTQKSGGYWEVMATNEAVRAWRTLGIKIFRSIDDVERHYKTFSGLSALLSQGGGRCS